MKSPLSQTETLKKKKPKTASKITGLAELPIIRRTCFICGNRHPGIIPLMHRVIDNETVSIRVCGSCKIGITKFTPARDNMFGYPVITDDPAGHFDDNTKVSILMQTSLTKETLELQDKTMLTILLIDKNQDLYKSNMTTDELVNAILFQQLNAQ